MIALARRCITFPESQRAIHYVSRMNNSRKMRGVDAIRDTLRLAKVMRQLLPKMAERIRA